MGVREKVIRYMNMRDRQIDAFLEAEGWSNAKRTSIAGDASNRRYERLARLDGSTAILMDAPWERGEDVRPFMKVARFLKSCGLSAPEIFSDDAAKGFLILEDLGDDIYARIVQENGSLEYELYAAAVDVLIQLARSAAPELAAYDAKVMSPLAALAFDWYQLGAMGTVEGKDEFEKRFQTYLHSFEDKSQFVLIQRDYHAENLLWLPDRQDAARVGLLDFQDAMLGHPSYDLVSILKDARRDVTPGLESQMIDLYIGMTDVDPSDFRFAYNAMGLQRNLRILGVFARLSMAYGKAHYIDLIPRVWDHIEQGLGECEDPELRDLLRKQLPVPTPEILESLKNQCGQHNLH